MTPVDDGRSDHATWRPAQTLRSPETVAPAHTAAPAPRREHAHSARALNVRRHRISIIVAITLIGACVVGVGWASGWGQWGAVAPVDTSLGELPAELSPLENPVPLTDQELAPYISNVAQRSTVTPQSWHLATGLAPPTNRWFSPLVFESVPQPVRPLPFEVTVGRGGFALSIPTDSAAPATSRAMSVDAGATSWLVSDYTDASVTLTLGRDNGALAEVVLTRGSPVVGYRALVDHTVTVDTPLTLAADGVFAASLDGRTLGLVGDRVALDAGALSFTVPAGASANWVAVPDGVALGDIAALAATTITDVSVSYLVVPDVTTTTVQFTTAGGEPAAFGVFNRLGGEVTSEAGAALDCGFGSFSTPEGRLRVCAGRGFSYAAPTVDPLAPFAYSTISESDRVAVVRSLSSVRAGIGELPRQVAPASPALSRLATLLTLARQVDDGAAITQLSTRLREELMTWGQLDGCALRAEQCFAYDPTLFGMVAFDDPATAEMSDARLAQNGAFLYAAGVAAQGDTELITRLRPMMTLLAADIVGSQSSHFAARRAFDPVSGNSWSSCEAWLQVNAPDEPCRAPRALDSSLTVAAYSGVAVWANTAGDPWLLDQMTWMLSVEQYGATPAE